MGLKSYSEADTFEINTNWLFKKPDFRLPLDKFNPLLLRETSSKLGGIPLTLVDLDSNKEINLGTNILHDSCNLRALQLKLGATSNFEIELVEEKEIIVIKFRHQWRKTSYALLARKSDLDEVGKSTDDLIQITGLFASLLLYRELLELGRTKDEIQDSIIKMLTKVLEVRDIETMLHSNAVANLALEIARKLGINENEFAVLEKESKLHDIGKLLLSKRILHKKEKLTAYEWDIIRMHPRIGAAILDLFPLLVSLSDGPLFHHERPNGLGYPNGLNAIQMNSITSAILTGADHVIAMLGPRPYRDNKGLTLKTIRELIQEASGESIDSRVATVIIDLIDNPSPPSFWDTKIQYLFSSQQRAGAGQKTLPLL